MNQLESPTSVPVRRIVGRRLCDNPTCSAHCEVVHDEHLGWRFANGFRMPLTKEQLMHFRPEAKFNVCGRCKGCYEHMLERARQIACRKLKPETHVVCVSPELIKPREQQIAESLAPPSGYLLDWLEIDSRSHEEAQPNRC